LARLNERSWPRVSRPYRALDLEFSVRTASADLSDYLESILEPLAAGRSAGRLQQVFSVVDDGERFKRRYAVYRDGQPIIRTPSEPQALLYLLWQLNRAVVTASDRYLLVHAAAATYGGSAILLPASMNAGKTTLVAGLVQRGFGYLTDEAAAIDPQTLMVDPFPKPLSIELGSWEALEALRPALDQRFMRFAEDQWYVVPDAIRPGAVAVPSEPRLIVTPRFEPAAKTTIEPMSRAEGVLMLAENSFNFASHKGAGLETLAAVVRKCTCYRLTSGSLEEACAEIMSAVDGIEAKV
jgi:hypothetical protein